MRDCSECSVALAFYLCAGCLGVASEAQASLLNIDAFGWVVLIGGVGVLGTFAAFGMYLWDHRISVLLKVAC